MLKIILKDLYFTVLVNRNIWRYLFWQKKKNNWKIGD